MRRLLLTPVVLAVLIGPALAGDEPPSATPPAATAGDQTTPAAPCECGGPGKCCGQATAAVPAEPGPKAGAPSCGCAAARANAEKALK